MSMSLGVVHARPPAGRRHQIAATAHRFDATTDGAVGITELDRIGCGHDGLKTGAAQAIDAHCAGFLRHAGIERDDARYIHVACLGMDHVTENQVLSFLGIDTGAGERSLHHVRAEVTCREVLQRTAVRSDRRTRSTNDHHFSLVSHAKNSLEISFRKISFRCNRPA
jgi:hypothetical protein